MRTLILSAVLVFVLTSCHEINNSIKGKGERITKVFEPGSFEELYLEGAYKVTLEKSSEEKIVIEAEENLIEHLEIDIRNDKLHISSHDFLYSDDGIEIAVFYKNLDELNIDGACTIEGFDILKADLFRIEMGGAGTVDLELDVRELEMDISGAGAVKLKGFAGDATVNMSGAGGLSAYKLITERCKIDISGVGSADIHVENELYASIGGLGGINYRGNPELKRSSVSGLGKIERVD